jgi:hypothetical protein
VSLPLYPICGGDLRRRPISNYNYLLINNRRDLFNIIPILYGDKIMAIDPKICQDKGAVSHRAGFISKKMSLSTYPQDLLRLLYTYNNTQDQIHKKE